MSIDKVFHLLLCLLKKIEVEYNQIQYGRNTKA